MQTGLLRSHPIAFVQMLGNVRRIIHVSEAPRAAPLGAVIYCHCKVKICCGNLAIVRKLSYLKDFKKFYKI